MTVSPLQPPASERPRVAVILAAGRGTRMRSELPKVLHEVAGKPMLRWVVEAARGAGCDPVFVVVPPDGDAVGDAIRDTLTRGLTGDDAELVWVVQGNPRGTGHALARAAEPLARRVAGPAQVLVLSGDTPLITAATLERLAAAAEDGWGALAVAELEDPGSLGRVLTRTDGGLERIVEVADAGPEELAVRRINVGLYAFPAPEIFAVLDRLDDDNAQGEIYLTDAPGRVADDGDRIALLDLPEPSEAFGVNTRAELARAHRRLLDRHLERLMTEGVTVLEPARTVVEPGVPVGRDTVLHPGVCLLGACRVGERCTLHQGVWARDAVIADDTTVEPYTVLDGTRAGTAGPGHHD